MDLATFDQLLSPAGTAALAAATDLRPTEAQFLAAAGRLRKHFPPALATAALEIVLLREKAKAKFAHAAEMFFTREALEQASHELVSRQRAERFRHFNSVGDFGCGIGGDALALAAVGCRVVALDRDPLRARMAELNLAANGFADRAAVRVANVLTDSLPPTDAVFADPGRRADGKRFVSLADYQPPPRELLVRLPRNHPAAFKLAPAVPWADLETIPGEAEFVSLGGELKECVLWLGPLAATRRRATVLPAGATLAADTPAPQRGIGPPGRYLYDPDPAVTRAGLVTDLGERLGAAQIDPTLAFLTADDHRPTPFATAYAVEGVIPFHAKRLGDELKARGVGRVTVVKRGSAVDSDELTRKWKLSGGDHRFVILTRSAGQPVALIADRVEPK